MYVKKYSLLCRLLIYAVFIYPHFLHFLFKVALYPYSSRAWMCYLVPGELHAVTAFIHLWWPLITPRDLRGNQQLYTLYVYIMYLSSVECDSSAEVSDISPKTGSLEGGTRITITGGPFDEYTEVVISQCESPGMSLLLKSCSHLRVHSAHLVWIN